MMLRAVVSGALFVGVLLFSSFAFSSGALQSVEFIGFEQPESQDNLCVIQLEDDIELHIRRIYEEAQALGLSTHCSSVSEDSPLIELSRACQDVKNRDLGIENLPVGKVRASSLSAYGYEGVEEFIEKISPCGQSGTLAI